MTVDVETFEALATELDLDYVAACGEALRARLFPRPKTVRLADGTTQEGPTPYPLPAALAYRPGDRTHALVLTPVRTFRQATFEVAHAVDEADLEFVPAECFDADANVDERWVLVVQLEPYTFAKALDLSFGVRADPGALAAPEARDVVALTVLLRAITGTL